MKPNRNLVTPFISLIFLIVGVSGLFMFFHWFDGYTEVVHEILGLFFVICAIFHVMLNWNALRIHFKRQVFLPALLGVLVISAGLIVSERMYPPVDLQIMNRIVKAPVQDAFKALSIDYPTATQRLKVQGIDIRVAEKFEDLWIKTGADPEEIMDLLLQ
jgi:glucan phosphoethanolaminetransferase (alkaline phosphatase superfamily)